MEAAGTGAIFVLSLSFAYIAIHVERFSRYGQEALLAAAAFLFTAGLMRLLVFAEYIEREQAVVVNSAAAISFALIGAQLAALRFVQARLRREQLNNR